MKVAIDIDGYDFTYDIKKLPTLDSNSLEWGNVDNNIINEILILTLPGNYRKFFLNGRTINKIKVNIKQDGNTIFSGFIDKIDYSINNMEIHCKSRTASLFNSYMNYPYIIDNAYPIDILRDLLELCNLPLNKENYIKNYNMQSNLNLKLSITIDNLNYTNIIENLAMVTCGIIYIENDEFYYDIFNYSNNNPSIPINNQDWLYYPKIEMPPSFSSVFNGIDIRFGNNYILNGMTNPSKIIDMSINNYIYTYDILTALYISDLYNYIGNHKKKVIKGTLKNEFSRIINKNSYIKWDDTNYRLININYNNNLGINIIGEAFV